MDTSTILNLISSFAVVGALIFTALQVRIANRTRAEQAAITIVEAAHSEGWTKGLNQIERIPVGASAEQIDALGPEVTAAIEQAAIRVETLGYMVWRRMVDIEMVEDLFGGAIVIWWSRIRPYALRGRERTTNPKLWEWFQWLAEQLEKRGKQGDIIPAYFRPDVRP